MRTAWKPVRFAVNLRLDRSLNVDFCNPIAARRVWLGSVNFDAAALNPSASVLGGRRSRTATANKSWAVVTAPCWPVGSPVEGIPHVPVKDAGYHPPIIPAESPR